MHIYQHFGECLKCILENHDLSILEASKILGMKSPTSLSRILHDEVNIKTLTRFYQILTHTTDISLLPEEKAQLEQSLMIAQVGLEQYLADGAMWKLLFPQSCVKPPYDIMITDYGVAENTFGCFSQLISFYRSCREIRLTITGCCVPAMVNALFPLLQMGTEGPSVVVDHYLQAHENAPHLLVGSIAAIRPLFAAPNYTAYIAQGPNLSRETIALYEGNHFLCSFVDQKGMRRYHHGVMTDANHVMLIEYRHEAPFNFQLAMLEQQHACLSPITLRFPIASSPYDYVDYTENYRKLAAGKSIYSIKPDIPLDFIHPDIVLPAARDAFRSMEIAAQASIDPLMQQLYHIQLLRWKNIFEKKKVTHIIFSFRAMMEFARTGVQSDHFFAMRPYTPAERKRILLHIRQQMQENPYFNVYFSSDESLPFQMEITGHDPDGVLMTDAHASYNLSLGHVEAVVTPPAFCRAFCHFFQHELLAFHVLSPKENLAMMDQLMAAIPIE